ncbi:MULTISPECIES: tetratricopeptide repeat protein [Hyphobacterium]|uniref:Tetratricopeptide repeat protein n=1 Tax=Hyphobacterium vulgare TaxID=1736751 RepID=A0ABV6ZZ03_9PROT
MTLRFLTALTGAASVLAACATTGDHAESDNPAEETQSAYGAFLAARFAGTSQDLGIASDYFAAALEHEPGSVFLADRTFLAATIAGDMQRSADAARLAVSGADESGLARLHLAAEAIRAGRGAEAESWLADGNYGPFNQLLADMLRGWALASTGDFDGALASADTMNAPGFSAPFVTMHEALLLDRAGRNEDAEAAYRDAMAGASYRRVTVELYGAFLERQGRRGEAEALYVASLAEAPGDPGIEADLERVRSGGRAPRSLSLSQMASRAILGPSAAVAAQADMEISILYLRLAQRLDPDYAPTLILMGGSLDRMGFSEAALDAFDAVPRGPFWMSSRIERLWLQARSGDPDGARADVRRLAEETGNLEALTLLADLSRANGELETAATLYEEIAARYEAQGDAPDWRYYFFRAAVLDQLGRWDEAEALFLRALEISPNEPDVLNHLGYVWVTQGRNIEEAFSMIRTAAAQEPDAGYIVDSLGWAHYVRGEYQEAVRHLERAVELDPASPTINFHLGDAYWQVGRGVEARYQWQRALELDPDPDEIEALNDRLATGIVPDLPETAMAEGQEAP